MAPEMSSGEYDSTVDVYSLAKDIHILMINVKYTPGEALLAVLNRMISVKPIDRPSAKELKNLALGRIEAIQKEEFLSFDSFNEADLYLKAEADVSALERQLAIAKDRKHDLHAELKRSLQRVYVQKEESSSSESESDAESD